MGLATWISDMLPFVAMIAVECTDVGASTLSKAALAKGMSQYVSVVYYNALGTLILLPYFILRRKQRPPLTCSLLLKFFLLALNGSTGQILFLVAVKLSSPTLSSAMANLAPIFTFLLAVIFGMEALNLRRWTSMAKVLGAIVAVTGALIVTLYQGPAILMPAPSSHSNHMLLSSDQSGWALGGFLLAIVMLFSAVWNIFQKYILKKYPDGMTVVFFFTFFITIQSAIFSLILERDPKAWILDHGIETITIVYTAVFGSLFRISIHTWCLHKKGPVYVAMFKPLGIVVAVILSVTFLGDTLHLGSVIGSVIITVGFYSVMWGQIKEKATAPVAAVDGTCCSSSSSGPKTPLLEQYCDNEKV
ncbi:hypothetical protein Tsubulata_050011 [Turnera subulata]|uniref:WAT1-related protein n=1 Tax=Turnera subulata TaxID=218843 RepID=A0A9Q0FX90_9ROSI|nr:hypothetical protein Tsubulata_050011 [Turnera subulata]